MEALARVSGRRAPRAWLPDWLVRRAAPFARLAAPLAGLSSSLVREGMAMADQVHWAFSSEKARKELGWAPRPLEEGLRSVVAFYRR
jgi:dihydroflavonol-4-reductase